tara:strand:+ start:264 stop:773 length:510 start_codon:yes stop_codon:yes gene_type:complete
MRLVTNNNRIKTQTLKKKHVSNVPVKSYAKSYVKWTAEEDATILNEREDGVYGYALRAATKLDGRDAQSINDRWTKILKKIHDPNSPVGWTDEEDAIILNEREGGVHGYALRAATKLEGRDVQSILDRWNKTLKKVHISDAPVKSYVKWTAEEDAIILRKEKIKPMAML